jgi:hypothetical protein
VQPASPTNRTRHRRVSRVGLAVVSSFLLATGACGKSGAQEKPPTQIGINVSTINTWDGSRPFMNMIYGSSWQSRDKSGASHDVTASQLDNYGWVKFLPGGHWAVRTLYGVSDAEIVCRWEGDDRGSMEIVGGNGEVRQSRKPGELRFRFKSSSPREPVFPSIRYRVEPVDYVRNIDCREADASRTARFDPTFLSTIRGFSVIRFMKWQTAVEANTETNWAKRNAPSNADYLVNDGVPIEVMIELAKAANADAWFSMPWNADDDYVMRFATLIRDNFPRDRKVYVEVSNEVWNGGYPVMRQAQSEGVAEGLDDSEGPYGQAMYRYAEKTRQVMKIWTDVFRGQTNRIVRVVSTQNANPGWSKRILDYRDTADHVDALATAPYWALSDEDDKGQSLDDIMGKVLPARIAETLALASEHKRTAAAHEKRYITYEGGQHVWLNHNDHLVAAIERDPRMYDLYKTYIEQWNRQIGDTLALFALTGGIGKAGFGLVEYAGQPIAEAPKMRAVKESFGQRSQTSR